MAYETKAIFSLLAESVGRCESVKEAYTCIVKAANIEGVTLPSYTEFIAALKKEREESE